MVVKPVSGGSSFGVSPARSAAELDAARRTAAHYDDRILIERVVKGREIERGGS